MILVAGATGLLGSEVCRRLLADGRELRVLVRPGSEPRLGDLSGRVEVVNGDLRDAAGLAAACRGVETVVSGVTAVLDEDPNQIDAVDRDGNLALLRAAQEAGVSRFVFVSIWGEIQGDYPLGRAKRAVEQALREAPLESAIVQPSCFMEVWLGSRFGLDAAAAQAQLLGSGDEPVSYVALDDVAEAVARVAVDGSANGVLALPGPPAVSQRAAVAAFERAAGRSFTTTQVPLDALRGALAQAADQRAESFASLMLLVAEGRAAMPQNDVARRLGIRQTTLEEHAERCVAALA